MHSICHVLVARVRSQIFIQMMTSQTKLDDVFLTASDAPIMALDILAWSRKDVFPRVVADMRLWQFKPQSMIIKVGCSVYNGTLCFRASTYS